MSSKWTSQERTRIQVDPGGELFSFDDASNTHGRLLPKQHVGRIKVAIHGSASDGLVTLSVRPKKLKQDTEYRRMLDDIAETATEAILQGFAPATIALEHDASLDPRLLYQQFAFLHARLSTSGEQDLAMIVNRPHTGWVDYEEAQPPGQPLRGTSRNLRALTRPGRRTPTSTRHPVASLPDPLRVVRTEETLDTEPNRFVSFALRRWRDIAQRLLDILQAQAATSGPVTRGIDAAEEVISAARQRAERAALPRGRRNQILPERQPGAAKARRLSRAVSNASPSQKLEHASRSIGTSKTSLERASATSRRSTSIGLSCSSARSVGRVCGTDLSAQALELSNDNLSLAFPRGKRSRLAWQTLVRGRSLTVTLLLQPRILGVSHARCLMDSEPCAPTVR